MPVVNYHSANGRLIGETTSGVRTDYMSDALGSVTGTLNASQAVVNTYRYKPYGELLAKTGSAADPRFMFTGSGGTETNQSLKSLMRLGASYPVNLSQSVGSCFESEFLCSQNREPLQSPGASNDCDLAKKKGFSVPYETVKPFPSPASCGEWGVWEVKFDLKKLRKKIGSGTQGFVIQHMRLTVDVSPHCKTGNRTNVTPVEFFETWYLLKSNDLVDGLGQGLNNFPSHDRWLISTGFPCTRGQNKIVGKLKFYEGPSKCAREWGYTVGGETSPRGWLVGGENPPTGWSDTGSTIRRATSTWNCCSIIFLPGFCLPIPHWICDDKNGTLSYDPKMGK